MKRYQKTLIALGAGLCVLTVAVLANYQNAGGYSACKNAFKKILFANNYTAKYKMEVKLDDTVLSAGEAQTIINGEGDPYSYELSWEGRINEEAELITTHRSESYALKSGRLHTYEYEGGGKESHYYPYDEGYPMTLRNRGAIIDAEDKTEQKVVTFIEKLGDAIVGDLKNSFVLAEKEEGQRTYQVELSKEQLPDWATSGLSMVLSSMESNVEDSRRYRLENPDVQFSDKPQIDGIIYDALFGNGQEPLLERATARMQIDAAGNPVYAIGSIAIVGFDQNGEAHRLLLSGEANFSDFGSTQIPMPNIYEVPNLRIYGEAGNICFVMPDDADAETAAAIREEAAEYAGYGNDVSIIKPSGEIIRVLSGAPPETAVQK